MREIEQVKKNRERGRETDREKKLRKVDKSERVKEKKRERLCKR